MTASLWGILAYAAGLIALGAWIGRRVGAAGSFFVADRKLGPVLLFATILAANLGAGTTVGAAGLAYRDGLSAWWWVGSAGIGTILLAVWVGPRIWQVAARHGLLTMGDYLELRYGRSVRLLIAGLLWFATLTIVSGQLIAMAEIVSVVAGSPRWVGALIGGIVVIVYFSAGGLVASAWVNLVQLVVILAGFAIAIPWALADIGGWSAVEAAAARTSPDYLSLWQGGASGWVYIALLAPAFIISPGLVQKVYGAANPRAIRTGLLAAGVALVLFAFAPTLLGMIARVYDPALASREQALPMLLATALPPALGLLGLAAVFSAEVSSADAGLFMLSTSLSKDLYKGFLRPRGHQRTGAARGARRRHRGRYARCAVGAMARKRDRVADDLLFDPEREPLRAGRGRTAFAEERCPRGPRRHRGRPRGAGGRPDLRPRRCARPAGPHAHRPHRLRRRLRPRCLRTRPTKRRVIPSLQIRHAVPDLQGSGTSAPRWISDWGGAKLPAT